MNSITFAPHHKEKIENYLTDNFGWKIDLQEYEFNQKMSLVANELECYDAEGCVRFIETHTKDGTVIKAFAREFSVGESYFFRDIHFFDRFEHDIIPKILQRGDRRLAIWSVGCSRGEELYSIAMMLRRCISNIDQWNLHLIGTDVNHEVLERARKGIYYKYSLRQLPEPYREYFEPIAEGYRLHPNVQKMANFKFHNILDSLSPCLPPDGKGFDLILINNVLIYFTLESAKKVVYSLYELVSEGGWIATTPTEYSMGVFDFTCSECLSQGSIIQKRPDIPFYSRVDTVNTELETPESADIDRVGFPLVENDKPKVTNLKKIKRHLEYDEGLKKIESGDFDGAKTALQQALYLNHGLVMAHIILANLFKKEGNPKAALKYLKNAGMLLQRMDPHAEVELSDGIKASDLLSMINTIEEETFE